MLHSPVRRSGSSLLSATFATVLLTAFVATLPCAAHAQETPAQPAPGDPTPPVTPTPDPTATPAAAAAPATQTTPATTTPTTDTAPSKPAHHRLVFGPEIGVYFPTSSKTQSAFGDAWYNFGLGLGAIQQTRSGGRFQLDFSYITQARNDKRVDIAPIGVSYRYGIGHSTTTGPYVGVSADEFLTQIRNDSAHIVSRIRGTGGGSVFIGTTFSERGYVQARYYELGSIRGYDFSGMNISTGYRF